MPIFSVPMIEASLLDLWRACQTPGNKPSSEAIMADREGRLSPVTKSITANTAAEAAHLAEAQNPGYVVLPDGISTAYAWTSTMQSNQK